MSSMFLLFNYQGKVIRDYTVYINHCPSFNCLQHSVIQHWQYGSGHFCIFCQMAAGWADCGCGCCCLLVSFGLCADTSLHQCRWCSVDGCQQCSGQFVELSCPGPRMNHASLMFQVSSSLKVDKNFAPEFHFPNILTGSVYNWAAEWVVHKLEGWWFHPWIPFHV